MIVDDTWGRSDEGSQSSKQLIHDHLFADWGEGMRSKTVTRPLTGLSWSGMQNIWSSSRGRAETRFPSSILSLFFLKVRRPMREQNSRSIREERTTNGKGWWSKHDLERNAIDENRKRSKRCQQQGKRTGRETTHFKTHVASKESLVWRICSSRDC